MRAAASSLLLAGLFTSPGCVLFFPPPQDDELIDDGEPAPSFDCGRLDDGVVVLAGGLDVAEVVVMGHTVVWLARSGFDGSATVFARALSSDEVTTLASGGRNQAYAAASDEHACWSDYTDDGAIRCWSARAQESFDVVTGEAHPLAVAVDDGRVFYSASGAVRWRHIQSSSSEEPVTLFEGAEDIVDIAARDGWVYWAGSSAHGGVSRVRVEGGEREIVTPDLGGPSNLAVDDEHVYVQHGFGISRFAPPDNEVERVVEENVYSFAIDDEHLYWTSPDRGAVKRRRKDNGEETELASGQPLPYRIAVHPCAVFWNDLADGAVKQLRK